MGESMSDLNNNNQIYIQGKVPPRSVHYEGAEVPLTYERVILENILSRQKQVSTGGMVVDGYGSTGGSKSEFKNFYIFKYPAGQTIELDFALRQNMGWTSNPKPDLETQDDIGMPFILIKVGKIPVAVLRDDGRSSPRKLWAYDKEIVKQFPGGGIVYTDQSVKGEWWLAAGICLVVAAANDKNGLQVVSLACLAGFFYFSYKIITTLWTNFKGGRKNSSQSKVDVKIHEAISKALNV